MITKIEKLKNIGNFEDYSASGDVTLKPFCIVYAENGAGKTTLSRVFHSLSTNDAGVVLRHKRIGGAGNPEITINNETPSPFVFSGTHWNRPCPDIEVFDAHFVANNVYSGFEMNSDHHKGLYQFVVGASGVSIINKIDRVKDLIANCNAEQRRLADLIISSTKEADYNQVIALAQDAYIDEKIKKKDEELTLAKGQAQILKQPVPQYIQNADLPFDYKEARAVMELTVEGIGQQYLDLVKAHLNELSAGGMTDSMDWVFKGKKMAGENCPFCGQRLDGAAELIEGYNQFFREEYRTAVNRATAIKCSFDSINVGRHLERLNNEYKRIIDQMRFWEPLLKELPAQPPFDLDSLKIEEKYQAVAKLFEKKALNPVDALNFEVLYEFFYAVKGIVDTVTVVNDYVKVCQEKITELRGKIRPAEAVEKELKALQLQKTRYETPLKGYCSQYGIIEHQQARLRNINTQLQQQQKAASNLLFQQYGQKTNDYLHNVFMTQFQIVNVRDGGFRGGSRRPNLDYTLTFNGTDILQDEGLQNTSFKNVLSEGDKNTIAFSFFLAKLTSDPNFANKIVVFDDPLTSLDQNRRHATIDQLMMLHSRCKQVIVLSHNLHFLIDLNSRYEVSKQDKKVLMILKGANNATLEPFELKREWMDNFKRGVMSMEDFVNHPHPNKQEEAVNAIRLTLELMLKLKCCTYLTDEGTTFGAAIAELEHKPCTFVNPNKAEVIAKLKNLNSISWRTHHATIEERAVYREVTLTMTEAVNYTRLALQMLQKEI